MTMSVVDKLSIIYKLAIGLYYIKSLLKSESTLCFN